MGILRFSRTLPWLGLLLFAVPVGIEAQPATGAVEVRVFTLKKELPVERASVYLLHLSRPMGGRIIYHLTDEQGRVSVEGIEPGPYRVAAFKTEDFYPDPLYAFASTEGSQQQVMIEPGRTARVTLRLGPPAGRLTVRAVDASSGAPLPQARLLVRRAGQSHTAMSVGGDPLQMLVPPDTPITVVVSGEGYRGWESTDAKSGANVVIVGTAAEKTITVRLRK